jgi:hypothetical protein
MKKTTLNRRRMKKTTLNRKRMKKNEEDDPE